MIDINRLGIFLSVIALIVVTTFAGYIFFISDRQSVFSPPPLKPKVLFAQEFAALEQSTIAKIAQEQQKLFDDQKALLDKVSNVLEHLSRRVGVMERDLAARPLPGALALARDVTLLRNDLEKQLDALTEQIYQPKRSAFALLGIGLAALKRAAASGGDFTVELENMRRIYPTSRLLDALTLYQRGVLSRGALFDEFDRAIAGARKSMMAPQSSIFLHYFFQLVRVRPLGELEGDSAPALLSQLTKRIEEGNISEALKFEAKLRAYPQITAAMAHWFSTAQDRVALNRLLAKLDLKIYEMLSKHQKQLKIKQRKPARRPSTILKMPPP